MLHEHLNINKYTFSFCFVWIPQWEEHLYINLRSDTGTTLTKTSTVAVNFTQTWKYKLDISIDPGEPAPSRRAGKPLQSLRWSSAADEEVGGEICESDFIGELNLLFQARLFKDTPRRHSQSNTQQINIPPLHRFFFPLEIRWKWVALNSSSPSPPVVMWTLNVERLCLLLGSHLDVEINHQER